MVNLKNSNLLISSKCSYNLRSKRIKRENENNASDNKGDAANGTKVSNETKNSSPISSNCSKKRRKRTCKSFVSLPNKCYNLRPRKHSSLLQSICDNENTDSRRSTSINDLPDECLLLIFDYLVCIRDKIRIERVCWRFKGLIGRLLLAQKTFSVNSTFGSSSKDCKIGLSKMMCRSVVSKCSNLVRFKLPGFYSKEKKPSERVGDGEMQLLGGTCKNLKELDICGCGNVSEEGLKYVVTNCRQLDKLSVSFCAYITCKCLSQLSKNFKHLSLNGNEWTPYLTSGLQALSEGEGKNLTELTVCWYDASSDINTEEILKLVCTKFLNLKCLRWTLPINSAGAFKIVGNLTNLTDLALDTEAFSFNDAAFIQIIQGCPLLRTLYLRIDKKSDKLGLTDYSIRKLPIYCPNVEKLHIISKSLPMNGVTDLTLLSLVRLKKLESLVFKSFCSISDDGTIPIFKSCLHLKNVCFYNCDSITKSTLQALVNVAKTSPLRKIKFALSGAKIDEKFGKLPRNLITATNLY